MKRAALVGVAATLLVALGAYAYHYLGFGSITVTNTPDVVKEFIEVEKEVPSDEVRIKEAQNAARADIEAKAQAAYDDMYQLEMNKIKADVLLEIETEIKSQRIEVEKEIGVY